MALTATAAFAAVDATLRTKKGVTGIGYGAAVTDAVVETDGVVGHDAAEETVKVVAAVVVVVVDVGAVALQKTMTDLTAKSAMDDWEGNPLVAEILELVFVQFPAPVAML